MANIKGDKMASLPRKSKEFDLQYEKFSKEYG